jgi:hypothetical protein
MKPVALPSDMQQFGWKIFNGNKLKSSPWGIDML